MSGSTSREHSNDRKKKIIFKNTSTNEDYRRDVLCYKFGERLGNSLNENLSGHNKVNDIYEDVKQSLAESLSTCKHSLTEMLRTEDKSLEELKIKVNEKIHETAISNNPLYQSMTDSEQILFQHLSLKPNMSSEEIENNLSLYYSKLHTNMREELEDYTKSLIMDKFKNYAFFDKKLGLPISIYSILKKEQEKAQNATIVGCILHIHSKNEICLCCSYTIAHEMNHGLGKGILEDYLEKDQDSHDANNSFKNPFFMIMTSCSQMLENSENGRPGIGHHFDAEYYEQDILPLNDFVRNGVFPQLFLGEFTQK